MKSKKEEIYNYVLNQIIEKKFSLNDRIPTEVELAEKFQTNRMNAYMAIQMLKKKGIVLRNKRQGTFVANANPHSAALPKKRVHVVTSFAGAGKIHWGEASLLEMEKVLNKNGYELSHIEFPEKLTRDGLMQIFSEIKKNESCAVIIFSNISEESIFIRDNIDILFRYYGDIYIYDRGSALFEKWPFHSICLDPLGEGIMVGEFLCKRGHENIVFLERDIEDEIRWMERRKEGLIFGLNLISNGKLKPEIWRFSIDVMPEKACQKILESQKKLTIVAPNDYFAVQLIESAKKMSLTVPDDFSLISFDNNLKFRKYNLTTVAPPVEKIGQMFGLFVSKNQLMKNNGNKISIKISSKIIVRKTCN